MKRDRRRPAPRIRGFAIRVLVIVYVAAALGGGGVLTWAADFSGNSRHPTPWPLAALIVFLPLAGALVGVIGWRRRPVPRPNRGWGVVLIPLGLLLWGGIEVVHDATACEADDDCIVLPTEWAIVALVGAWLAGPALLLPRWQHSTASADR